MDERRWRRVRRNLKALVGAPILGGAILAAVAAPQLAPHDPLPANPRHRLRPPAWSERGSPAYALGTDQLGRDILSRLLYGARISLAVGILSVAVSVPLGVGAGLVAGFRGGVVDEVVMRLVDSQLSIPFLLLAIAIIAVIGTSTLNTILVLGIGGWTTYARMVRAEILSLREKEFVEAARAIGAFDVRIAVRHILPHVMTSVSVIASFATAHMILLESTLSFLGLGVQPPTPSWGQMLSDGKNYVSIAWWLATFPGLAIAVTVLGINFIGDWVRDRLSPYTRTV